jgi:hypothetical protein
MIFGAKKYSRIKCERLERDSGMLSDVNECLEVP